MGFQKGGVVTGLLHCMLAVVVVLLVVLLVVGLWWVEGVGCIVGGCGQMGFREKKAVTYLPKVNLKRMGDQSKGAPPLRRPFQSRLSNLREPWFFPTFLFLFTKNGHAPLTKEGEVCLGAHRCASGWQSVWGLLLTRSVAPTKCVG